MNVKTWLSAWALSFSVSFGSVAALVTAFDLPGVSLFGLGVYCLLLSCLCAREFSTRYGHRILLGFLGVFVVCCLIWGGLWRSVAAVSYHLSRFYDAAYGWGVPNISMQAQQHSPLPALWLLAMLPAVLISWAVCRRKKLAFCLSIALLPLYPCFVVTDTVPESWCFLLILAASLVLVLSQSLRRLSHHDGNRITAIALIPAVLLSAFLLGNIPQEGYWMKLPMFQSLTQHLPSQGENMGIIGSAPGMPGDNRTNLADIGPQTQSDCPVMEVRSGYTGLLYLRYQSFDSYSGTQWSNVRLSEDPAFWPTQQDLSPTSPVSISTEYPFDGMFIPYYSRSGNYLQLENGKLPNPGKLSQYWISTGQLLGAYPPKSPDLSPYLALPKDTREAAQRILQAHDLQTPEQILQYVKNSAAYDLDTGRMPSDNPDFAIWFLENSETGYCVHFASAAAVLLRAAGFPARYVTGYAVMTQRGKPKTVTEDMAHAWVEYADSETGYFWQVLEATPDIWTSDPVIQPSTQPDETTEPTQEPTEVTQPSTQESTLPDNTTPSGSVTHPVTTPSTSPIQQEEPPMALNLLWTVLRYMGLLIAGVAVLWGQYTIRLRQRWKKQRTGKPNARALARWQEIELLGRLLKAQPPEELLVLAEKARFSQHTLTKEELFRLGQYLQRQRKAILALPVWKRFFLKLIWAI